MNICGNGVPGRVESKCKGPEAEMGMFHFTNLENLGSQKLTFS